MGSVLWAIFIILFCALRMARPGASYSPTDVPADITIGPAPPRRMIGRWPSGEP